MYPSYLQIHRLIAEAKLLASSLPRAAWFWVVATQARFAVKYTALNGTAKQLGAAHLKQAVSLYNRVLQIASMEPQIFGDPFAVRIDCLLRFPFSLAFLSLPAPASLTPSVAHCCSFLLYTFIHLSFTICLPLFLCRTWVLVIPFVCCRCILARFFIQPAWHCRFILRIP